MPASAVSSCGGDHRKTEFEDPTQGSVHRPPADPVLAMPIVSADLPFAAAVKKGPGALEKVFRDHPEDDFEDRAGFQLRKVEFTGGGLCHSITIKAGEDPSSPDVTVPNPLWGLECHPIMELLGAKLKNKTIEKKRLHTNLEFVIWKLSGVVGVIVTRMDFQQIVGKKHVKNKRKRSEMEVFESFDDEEGDEQPTWSIPGMDKIYSRGELALTALEIEDVVANEAQNMLTVSFKRPLRAFAQKSHSKDGEITFEEVAPSKMASEATSTGDSQQTLGRELLGIVPRTEKMNLYFQGGWDDPNIFGNDGEGKTCLSELSTYLTMLRKMEQAVEKKREVLASFRKRQDEQKGRRFCDLEASSYARKAVETFDLDITEETGYWEPSVLEEEWKAWYDLRQKAESSTQADFEEGEEEEEEEEEDLCDHDEGYFESSRFRRRMLKDLRKDYEKALKDAGFSAAKAQAAAKGLYVNDVNIVEDGGEVPRTCSVSVRIFSAVGRARLVDLEHEHHARARTFFCEEYAYIKAQVSAFDPQTGTFKLVDDLADTIESFSLFNMDVHAQTGARKYSLASANQVQKLVASIFGQKSRGSFLSDWAAFHVLMMASGADAHPFTEMDYDDFCPLSYLDTKFRKKMKK